MPGLWGPGRPDSTGIWVGWQLGYGGKLEGRDLKCSSFPRSLFRKGGRKKKKYLANCNDMNEPRGYCVECVEWSKSDRDSLVYLGRDWAFKCHHSQI